MSVRRLRNRLIEPLFSATAPMTPVLVVEGPRQTGKRTLARTLRRHHDYVVCSLDDDAVRARAAADPVGFVDGLPPWAMILEAHRVPEVVARVLVVAGREPRVGRFVLTTSGDLRPLMAGLAHAPGLVASWRVHPFAASELEACEPVFLERLFAGGLPPCTLPRLQEGLFARVAAGGYPAALIRADGGSRSAWFKRHVEAVIAEDCPSAGHLRAADVLPALVRVAALHTAEPLNFTALASPFDLSRPTIKTYLELLERCFLVERLPAWSMPRGERLVKTPKLHLGDSGLACALLGGVHDAGASLKARLLETYVYQELRRMAARQVPRYAFYHLRDRDRVEVDVVIERADGAVVALDIRLGGTVRDADFRGLRKLRTMAGERFVAGVLLHDGEVCREHEERLFSAPMRMLWEA